MTVATKRRRTRKPAPDVPGKTAWAIERLDDETVVRQTGHGAGVALVLAQGYAQREQDPVVYHVVRRNLFGPATVLYRVTREEDGAVTTTTVNLED